MGFGLLLVGYFTATVMSFNMLGGVFSFVGYTIMLFASKKLMQYNRSFTLLLASTVLMILLSAVTAISDVSTLLQKYMLISYPLIGEGVASVFLNVRLVLELIFTAVLCYCVRGIAKETGAEKIVYTAVRNFVFFCISFALQVVVWLAANTQLVGLTAFVNGTALPIWMVIINLVCLLLNCFMIFSCYSRICDENDLEMPQKPSRFAFINRRREEKERKRQQYIEEAEKYAEERKAKAPTVNKSKNKK